MEACIVDTSSASSGVSYMSGAVSMPGRLSYLGRVPSDMAVECVRAVSLVWRKLGEFEGTRPKWQSRLTLVPAWHSWHVLYTEQVGEDMMNGLLLPAFKAGFNRYLRGLHSAILDLTPDTNDSLRMTRPTHVMFGNNCLTLSMLEP